MVRFGKQLVLFGRAGQKMLSYLYLPIVALFARTASATEVALCTQHRGAKAELGDKWELQGIRYECFQDGDTTGYRPIACTTKNGDKVDGETWMDDNFIYRCYQSNKQTLGYKIEACLSPKYKATIYVGSSHREDNKIYSCTEQNGAVVLKSTPATTCLFNGGEKNQNDKWTDGGTAFECTKVGNTVTVKRKGCQLQSGKVVPISSEAVLDSGRWVRCKAGSTNSTTVTSQLENLECFDETGLPRQPKTSWSSGYAFYECIAGEKLWEAKLTGCAIAIKQQPAAFLAEGKKLDGANGKLTYVCSSDSAQSSVQDICTEDGQEYLIINPVVQTQVNYACTLDGDKLKLEPMACVKEDLSLHVGEAIITADKQRFVCTSLNGNWFLQELTEAEYNLWYAQNKGETKNLISAVGGQASGIQKTAANCVWSDWSEPTPCTAACGGGTQTKTRKIAVPAENGGEDCAGSTTETTACNTDPCPVDCAWGPWSEYSTCSALCGGGTQSRSRVILTAAAHGGKPCAGDANEITHCNIHGCPVDCVWSNWSSYGVCSVACGGGEQKRTRAVETAAVNGGAPCTGDASESAKCNTQACPVNCVWGTWSNYGSCSVNCGGGTQWRNRSIVTQAANGGTACTGSTSESTSCNTQGCPVNCVWGSWTSSGSCSRNCGGGVQWKTRSIQVHAAHGGSQCSGSSWESVPCNTHACPVNCVWGSWSGYSACSATCNGGTRSRSRSIATHASNGGAGCSGGYSDYESCNTQRCPELCVDVYQHINFGGDHVRYCGSVPNFASQGFNDKISSFRLNCAPDCKVIMYQHHNFGGYSHTFSHASHNDFTKIGFNDVASSLQVVANANKAHYTAPNVSNPSPKKKGWFFG